MRFLPNPSAWVRCIPAKWFVIEQRRNTTRTARRSVNGHWGTLRRMSSNRA
jgi:hypothetical protein